MKTTSSQAMLKFKLDALLNITKAINQNVSIDCILDSFVDVLCNQLSIGKLVMFHKSDKWDCILSHNIEVEKIGISVEKDLESLQELTFVNEADSPIDIIIPISNNNKKIAFVLIGDIDAEQEGMSPVLKHLLFIQTLSSIIAVAIENLRLFKKSLAQEAIKKELQLASQMQKMLIPDINRMPHNEFVAADAFYKPHYSVGGDYFDCIDLGDGKIGFCVADVSGKGISAAMLMSNFQATLRALFTSDIDIEQLTHRLNQAIFDRVQGDRFITLFLARYDCQTRRLEYVNAGHTTVILFGVESKRLTFIDARCPGIGMLDQIPNVRPGEMIIEEHSTLISYSDGLVEVLSDSDENEVDSAFDVLVDCVKKSENIKDLTQCIIKTQKLETKNEAIFDDVTLLGIEFFSNTNQEK